MRSVFSRLPLRFLFLGLLALGAGCTPSESFCPNAGADAGGVCPIFGDDAMTPLVDTGVNGNLCPPGQHAVIDPTADAGYRCE